MSGFAIVRKLGAILQSRTATEEEIKEAYKNSNLNAANYEAQCEYRINDCGAKSDGKENK